MAATASLSTKEERSSAWVFPPLEEGYFLRLIQLESRGENSEIVLSVRTYHGPSIPQYVALSYTWGDPVRRPYVAEKPSKTITVNSKPFLVTPNLYDALDRLNHLGFTKLRHPYLWVDAICIDQNDVLEWNRQVKFMGQTYGRAWRVLIWVGRPDEDSLTALRLVKRLRPLIEFWQSGQCEITDSYDPDKLCKKTGVGTVSATEWSALCSFYRRHYFSRAWIVQEILLARNPVLLHDSPPTHWRDLMKLSTAMTDLGWISSLATHCRVDQSTDKTAMELGASALHGHIHFLWSQYCPGRNDLPHDSAVHPDVRMFYRFLERLLSLTHNLQATDPRDLIYALSSIVSLRFGGLPLTKSLFLPDYRLSVREVFINVTCDILTKTSSATIFSLVAHGLKPFLNLPSWVPDFTVASLQPLLYWSAGNVYQAFNQANRYLEIAVVDDILSLCAVCWDTITETELSGHSLGLDGKFDFCSKLPHTYFNGQSRVEALWRTLVADADEMKSPASDTVGNSFYGYVFFDGVKRTSKLPDGDWHSRELEVPEFNSLEELSSNDHEREQRWFPTREEATHFRHWLHMERPGSNDFKSVMGGISRDARLFHKLSGIIGHGRKLFMTENSLLGLASTMAQPGDTVWFFPSSPVPFILRHCGGKQYKLIGEAYLHGYMHGELERFSMPLQRISLV